MIDIISNNCVASRLYQKDGIQFNHPFVWSLIDVENFVKLIKNFQNIDFSEYKIFLEKNNHLSKYKSVGIRIDDSIDVHYIHYIKDEESKEPLTKKGANNHDIFFKDIECYAEEKFKSRVARMGNTKFDYMYSFNYSYLKLSELEYQMAVDSLFNISNEENVKLLIIMNDNCNFRNYCEEKKSSLIDILWLSEWECTLTRPEHYSKIKDECKRFSLGNWEEINNDDI